MKIGFFYISLKPKYLFLLYVALILNVFPMYFYYETH